MKCICFYLSDHGFGHVARNIPIIVSVVKNYDTFVYVVCGERHIEFAKRNLETMLTAEQYKRVAFRADHTDVGLICKDGTLDVDKVITVTGNEEDEYVDGSTMYFKNKYSATGKTNIPGSKILTEGLNNPD